MGVWFCSMESKKSMRSGSGPLFGLGFVSGRDAALFDTVGNGLFDAGSGREASFFGFGAADAFELEPPPLFFASCSAKYCRRWISKSESFRYSSNWRPKLTGACFNLGTSTLV